VSRTEQAGRPVRPVRQQPARPAARLGPTGEPRSDLGPEDLKIVTLARSARPEPAPQRARRYRTTPGATMSRPRSRCRRWRCPRYRSRLRWRSVARPALAAAALVTEADTVSALDLAVLREAGAPGVRPIRPIRPAPCTRFMRWPETTAGAPRRPRGGGAVRHHWYRAGAGRSDRFPVRGRRGAPARRRCRACRVALLAGHRTGALLALCVPRPG
jgi:hypothetical protein